MALASKRFVGALVAFALLFAAVARAPGTMMTVDDGYITFEICSGTGVETITVPLGESEPQYRDTGCDFFAAQVAALNDPGGFPVLAVADGDAAHRLPFREIAFRRIAQNSYLTRGPPFPS